MTAVAVGLLVLTDTLEHECLLAGVSRYERKRYHTLKRRSQRARHYLASRWLLRTHIGAELGLNPNAVPLRDAVDGPPVVADSDLRIGLSHSRDVCLCITSNHGRVGCDAEWQRPGRHLQQIAAQYFDPAEAACLQRMRENCRMHGFHQLWTLKEATQKALGVGLAGGLQSPAFALAPTLHCMHTPATGPWTFASATLHIADDRYSLALAIGGITSPARFDVTDYSTVADPAAGRYNPRWHVAT